MAKRIFNAKETLNANINLSSEAAMNVDYVLGSSSSSFRRALPGGPREVVHVKKPVGHGLSVWGRLEVLVACRVAGTWVRRGWWCVCYQLYYPDAPEGPWQPPHRRHSGGGHPPYMARPCPRPALFYKDMRFPGATLFPLSRSSRG